MNKQLKTLSMVAAASLAFLGSGAMAEQTAGSQTTAAPAIATAHVNVRVTVPKIVMLRVGAADATVSDVDFMVAPNSSGSSTPGNSLAYTGAIPPALAITVTSTNPITTAGTLTVAAWTNSTGATLACSLSALSGTTAFATGVTAAGVPGTTDLTVSSIAGANNLQHPGTNLSACNSGTTTSIARLTALGGSFTYGTAFAANTVVAGIYGNVVTYTATTL